MASITIRNLPDEILGTLEARAREHGRSLNGEVICCLRTAVGISRRDVEKTMAAVDRARVADGVRLVPELLKSALKEGRA